MSTPVQLKDAKSAGGIPSLTPDQAVDMFTERGFSLANRIAKAYASSDAVPAQFRSHNLKKAGIDEHWVENPSAIGNCLVAIEVARAVRMSITAVMQNADMIEGKLRWSGKFVIAAINASGRFTPLRFQMINRGRITAKYKEKTGWNKEARKPIFEDRQVEVDDIECIAWALPKGTPEPRLSPDDLRKYPGRMLDLYRDIGMPVIESAPVTMQMVVEEGWFGKSGSKWQTGLRALMFQYRAGSFFGNIHAPDIVMGMGRSSEEEADVVDVSPDGSYTVYSTTIDELRGGRAQPADEVPRGASQAQAGPATESHAHGATPAATQADPVDDQDGPQEDGGHGQGGFDFDVAGLVRGIREDIESAKTPEDLDLARSAISGVPDETAKAELNALASARMRAITAAAEQSAAGKATAQTTAPAGRRTRGPISAD
ncbi:hypothetical protein DP57_2347 [Burkholderia pseudomallei]|uniref:hypothetical protein n=1 Tax=Burkholderia pseudomallei TaxID=28450 RepID=UPI00050E4835|nr:hypothetical protein [Burkholderia pseudomallei]KGC66984.1 hypothetical protein DP57_2347 [Burkholderia pseudomallei]KGS05498.1 hypothetical protein X977_743 [Burkholderia pseudomallei MSHR7504]OMW98003.1 hypothetical protein AQ819_19350 [Burkholderia pseudomallei]